MPALAAMRSMAWEHPLQVEQHWRMAVLLVVAFLQLSLELQLRVLRREARLMPS